MSTGPSTAVEAADTVSNLLYGIAGWLLVGLGALGIVATLLRFVGNAPTSLGASVAVLTFSLLFVVFGVFVNPRFRRVLDERRSVGTFGTVRSVDQRVFHAEEGRTERCTACNARTREGLVRRYRAEVCVAGIPVAIRSEGRNYYCPDCGSAELGSTASINEASDAEPRTSGDREHNPDAGPATERNRLEQ